MFALALRGGSARENFGLVRAVAQHGKKPLGNRLIGDRAVEGVQQHAAIGLAVEEALYFHRSRSAGADLRHKGGQGGKGGLFCHVLDLLGLCRASLGSGGVASRVSVGVFSLTNGYEMLRFRGARSFFIFSWRHKDSSIAQDPGGGV